MKLMKGGIKMPQITGKELLYIDDALSLEDHMCKCLKDCAIRLQDQQLKVLCQNLSERCCNNFNSLLKNIE
jgi:hypothetical protein